MLATKKTTAAAGGGGDEQALLSPLIVALAALLAIQLVAALVAGLGGSDLAPAASQGRLVAFDADQVTRIRVDGPESEGISLEKSDGAWRIPELGGFPASAIKVDALLGKLASLQKRLPVATSEDAARRFRVADEAYERRLSLEGPDGPVASLYLGDSSGFRRLFVRAAGEPEVYEAELALFDASGKADDWTDKRYLHVASEDIRRLALPDATLERTDDGWVLADAAEGEAIDQAAVADALSTFANLDFRGVLRPGKAKGTEGEPETVIGVTLASGETREYRLYDSPEGDVRLLQLSSEPYTFELAAYSGAGLSSLGREGLLAGTGEEPPAAETSGPSTEADGAGANQLGAEPGSDARHPPPDR